MSLVITPLAFALAGYLLMWAAFGSVINPIAGVWNMITADYADRESEDLMTNRLDGYTQTVPSSLITFPRYGDKCAELAIESADISAPVYYGDGNSYKQSRRKGHNMAGDCRNGFLFQAVCLLNSNKM